MVLVSLQWLKGTQFLDGNGNPYDGGKLFIQDAGTTSLRTTYSDQAGTIANTYTSNKIILDSDGRLSESVYIPTGLWKLTFTDSSDVTIFTEDSILGALDTSAFTVTSAKMKMPWISKTSNYTVGSGDLGKGIAANPTGGSFAITLISAATAGDGKTIAIRHTGSTNTVTINTVSSQKIQHFDGGATRTSWVLDQKDQTVWLASDGANWYIVSTEWDMRQHKFQVADQNLSAPPASPAPGAWYIVGASPTGDWSTFAQYDLVQANGSGGWLKITPADGWLAFVDDEDVLSLFHGSQWNALPNTDAPLTSTQGVWFGTYQENNGVNSVFTTALAAFSKIKIATEKKNTITGASLDVSTSVLSLPVGEYRVIAITGVELATGQTKLEVQKSGGTAVAFSPQRDVGSGESATLICNGVIDLSGGADTITVQLFTELSVGSSALGIANADTKPEVYATLMVVDLKSLQGPQGNTGPQGASGAAGPTGPTGASAVAPLDYQWNVVLSGDPGSGKCGVDSLTYGSVTNFRISETDRLGNSKAADIANLLGSASSVRAFITVTQADDATKWISFTATAALNDNGSYDDFTISPSGSGTSIDDASNVVVNIQRTGDPGSGLSNVVDDTTPQLGGQLDVNGQAIGDGTREMLSFVEDASAVNHIEIENEATGSAPIMRAAGDDTNIDLLLAGKGSGKVKATNIEPATTSIPGVVDRATIAEVRNPSVDGKYPTIKDLYDAAAEVTLTDAATVALDLDTGIDFIVTLGGNRTLGNPTNVTIGKRGRIRVVQDGTGSRTLAYSSNYEFAGGTAITLSTAASSEDVIYYDCISATRAVLSAIKGIS